jgi:hypothetical protein
MNGRAKAIPTRRPSIVPLEPPGLLYAFTVSPRMNTTAPIIPTIAPSTLVIPGVMRRPGVSPSRPFVRRDALALPQSAILRLSAIDAKPAATKTTPKATRAMFPPLTRRKYPTWNRLKPAGTWSAMVRIKVGWSLGATQRLLGQATGAVGRAAGGVETPSPLTIGEALPMAVTTNDEFIIRADRRKILWTML